MAGFKLTKSLMKVLFPKKKKTTSNDHVNSKSNAQHYDELLNGGDPALQAIDEKDEQMFHLLQGSSRADSTPGTIMSSFSFSGSPSPSRAEAVDKCVGEDSEGRVLTVSIQCDSFEIDEALGNKEFSEVGANGSSLQTDSINDKQEGAEASNGSDGMATQTEHKTDGEERKYIGVARMRRKMIREQRMREKAAKEGQEGEGDDVPRTPNVRTTRVVDQAKSFQSIVFYENSPPPPSNPSSHERLVEETSEQKDEKPGSGDDDVVKNLASAMEQVDTDGFPVSPGSQEIQLPSSSPREKSEHVQFFILLLCPKSRIFELIEITDASKDSTISDILSLIPKKCTDERLLEMDYIGFCRPSDRAEFTNLSALAFQTGGEDDDWIATDSVREDDVLVAVLRGSTGYEMSKISKPILRNPKFKDMVRRRRRSNHQRSRKSSSQTVTSEMDYDSMSFSGDISLRSSRSKRSTSSRHEKKKEYSSLCKKLEDLSKKLHKVDDEIMMEDRKSTKAKLSLTSEESNVEVNEEALTPPDAYKMSPKMVANELAQNIQEIFADHDVEILAVDAEESDDDTFVSARSMRSMRSMRSLVLGFDSKPPLLGDKPFEITTKKKKKRKPREKKYDDSYEDNALALQIEAMAAEAESAFQRRHVKETPGKVASNSANADSATRETKLSADAAVVAEPKSLETGLEIIEDDDPMPEIDAEVDASFDASNSTAVEAECSSGSSQSISRSFINSSTSMVSTLVAASQGRVNEVHVLQYLGATIVCIAANIMQQNRQSGTPTPPFGPNEVFQSAMFLAFMHNGQRYMARVTKKEKSDIFT